jgi:hypothetical protein
VMRLLVAQQAEIARLTQQTRQLRAAVCRLDPKAPLCRRGGGGGNVGGGGDTWSSD